MIRSQEEEVVNAASHFISAIITFLITFLALLTENLTAHRAFPIYIMGVTAGWAFLGSYMYHSSYTEPKRERNRIFDKASIYLMIAGSGIGMSLTGVPTAATIVCCLLLFLVAALLIANLCTKRNISETFSVTSYVLMGWLALLPASGILSPCALTSGTAFLLVLAGGLCYSVGVVFYVGDSKKWYHTIWHIFTIVGFAFHFLAMSVALDLF